MSKKKVFSFQTEVKQLLDLVINSLYSNREIFMRELISNSSDAIEKLRFASLKKNELIDKKLEPSIMVTFDKIKQKIKISDNGIGMSREEIIENLGTIAKSGTKKFLQSIQNDVKDSKIIGKFGVGFYSSYIVANKVKVISRKAGTKEEDGVKWCSNADGSFEVENIKKKEHGTDVILYLKEKEKHLLSSWKLRQIITKYSDHISLPIKMNKVKNDKEGKETITKELEKINKANALWTRQKNEINEKEYKEFYKHISHDYNEPLSWIHKKIEGKLEYTCLLYIPKNPPFDLWDREKKSGISIYIQKTFIMENESILPTYLRFIKGVIDSNELPLNISREILQHNNMIEKIKKSITNNILNTLLKISKQEPEKYQIFWKSFGQVIKEGPAEDIENKEKIAKLLRFNSTYNDNKENTVSLDQYIKKMKKDQKFIYYVTAESYNAAKNNPQLEIFEKNKIEVLLLSDRVDEWMTSHLSEYNGITLKPITKGEIELNSSSDDNEKEEEIKKEHEDILKQMKNILKNKVETVRLSKRLTNSPSCIVVKNYGMSLHLQKMMSDAGQNIQQNNNKPILEINNNHKIIKKLKVEKNEKKIEDWTNILYEQAMLIEGAKLENPVNFIKLINTYLTKNMDN